MSLLIPELPPGGTYGVLAEFTTPRELYHACEKVRDAGFTRWDSHAPFPIHGLDKAMGLRRSKLPFVALFFGLGGAAAAMGFQWWVHTQAYEIIISGKPFFSWPAFVPVTFEVGVLSAAAAAVIGMLGFNRLPMHHHPLFESERFAHATDDAFFISVESSDPRFEETHTMEFLEGLGARHLEVVHRASESA